MANIFYLFLFVLAGETSIHVLLFILSKIFGKEKRDKVTGLSIFKGMLERTFVVVTLHFDMVSSLTLLGALKIATRIKDTDDKVSNDFFLIGNLISVLFAIVYYVLLKDFIGK